MRQLPKGLMVRPDNRAVLCLHTDTRGTGENLRRAMSDLGQQLHNKRCLARAAEVMAWVVAAEKEASNA